MAIVEKTMWSTEDGHFFESRTEAEAHEKRFDIIKEIGNLTDEEGQFLKDDWGHSVKLIADNSLKILSILKRHLEPEGKEEGEIDQKAAGFKIGELLTQIADGGDEIGDDVTVGPFSAGAFLAKHRREVIRILQGGRSPLIQQIDAENQLAEVINPYEDPNRLPARIIAARAEVISILERVK